MPDRTHHAPSRHDTYHHLISLLDSASVDYHLIDHEPEGATEAVCALRGHRASEAASPP